MEANLIKHGELKLVNINFDNRRKWYIMNVIKAVQR